MSVERAIPGALAKFVKRYGGTYTFTKAGDSKFNPNLEPEETIKVRGLLIAKGRTVQLLRHSAGSTGKVTDMLFYSTDHAAAQITNKHSIHADSSANYAVESIRQVIHTIGVWVISFSV